ncbi:aspartyl-phosphate phosphatase Spo0E family protein [Clostridium perfringens]|nr:aspartyl-phosphate phosphatase Spo0E family protein [Clostridium perfringens]
MHKMSKEEFLFRYKKDIELKKKMYKAIEEYGIESEEALRLSQELDILIFQEQEKKIG